MIKQNEQKIFKLIITIPIVFFIIFAFVLLGIYYNQEQNELKESIKEFKISHLKSKKELIKEETQRVIQTIKEGKLTIEEYGIDKKMIQKRLLNKISKIRFGKNGYFFIYDYNGVNLMHPIKPQLVGKNLYNLKDKNGVLLIQELIDSAKSGGKYTYYVWDNPKTKKLENKIGYALGIDDWGWMIGTGLYTEDIKNEIMLKTIENKKKLRELVYSILPIVLISILIMAMLLYVLLNKIKNNILVYNKDLEIQTQKALAVSKTKSEFLANMSHEIRTPLNAVLGFIGLLKEETQGEKSIAYVEIIESSSKSLLKIIEDILDFSKIESGKLDIDKVDFNTKTEFEVITHLFDAKCSEKDITLTLNLDSTLPQMINTDPLRIKQIISNLLSNAIKFTSNGKNIIVDINYQNNILNVSVKDNGIGIASDKLSHIFEAFSQEDSSTTRKYGGTGLGLSISSELVKLLGGELKLKSEVGVGSEFYFSVPAALGKEVTITTKTNEVINFENKKILLVEDNKANQMFMKVVLKKMNLEYDIASDGVEAIENFKNHQYDAILMDENMPNMNGIEATKNILQIEKENNLTHTPIIALTANALKGDRERFLAAGMDEYMTKPLNKKKLSEILNNILKVNNV